MMNVLPEGWVVSALPPRSEAASVMVRVPSGSPEGMVFVKVQTLPEPAMFGSEERRVGKGCLRGERAGRIGGYGVGGGVGERGRRSRSIDYERVAGGLGRERIAAQVGGRQCDRARAVRIAGGDGLRESPDAAGAGHV